MAGINEEGDVFKWTTLVWEWAAIVCVWLIRSDDSIGRLSADYSRGRTACPAWNNAMLHFLGKIIQRRILTGFQVSGWRMCGAGGTGRLVCGVNDMSGEITPEGCFIKSVSKSSSSNSRKGIWFLCVWVLTWWSSCWVAEKAITHHVCTFLWVKAFKGRFFMPVIIMARTKLQFKYMSNAGLYDWGYLSLDKSRAHQPPSFTSVIQAFTRPLS